MKVKDILKRLEGADPDMDVRLNLGDDGYALLRRVEYPKPYDRQFIALYATASKKKTQQPKI